MRKADGSILMYRTMTLAQFIVKGLGFAVRGQIGDLRRHVLSAARGANEPCGLYLLITRQCNMSCPMCMTKALRSREAVPELDRNSIREKVLVPGKQLGLEVITVSGGEPTLCEHLLGTLEDATQLGYSVYLATNLLSVPKSLLTAILRILNHPKHTIQVSFDSLDRQEMNSMRGGNVYDSVVNNCRTLFSLRNELSARTRLHSLTVLQTTNRDSVVRTVKFLAHEFRFDKILIQPLTDYSIVTIKNYRTQPFPHFSEEERTQMLEIVHELFQMARKEKRIVMTDPNVEHWVRFYTDPLSIEGPCGSVRNIYVDTYGNLRGCLNGEVLNNLNDVSMAQHLTSESYQSFLKLASVCKICIHGCS